MTQEQSNVERITKLEEGQAEILRLLRPIADTYTTASTIGKWGMGLLVFVSVSIGIVLSIKSLLNK